MGGNAGARDGSFKPVRFWYSDESENAKLAEDKKITAFEGGKTYRHSIKLETCNENFLLLKMMDCLFL